MCVVNVGTFVLYLNFIFDARKGLITSSEFKLLRPQAVLTVDVASAADVHNVHT
jgi:hypothetical protein